MLWLPNVETKKTYLVFTTEKTELDREKQALAAPQLEVWLWEEAAVIVSKVEIA